MLELVDAELASDPAELDVDEIGVGEVDLDGADVVPDEVAPDLDTLEVGDRAVAEEARHARGVVDDVLEVDVALAVEIDDEVAVGGDGEGLDGVGEDAGREFELLEDVVDGGAVGRRGRRLGDHRRGDGGREEERKVEKEEEEGGGHGDGSRRNPDGFGKESWCFDCGQKKTKKTNTQ